MAQQETQQSLEPQYDKSLLGKTLAETEIEVTADVIIRYAQATGESNPKYLKAGPDLEAPPGIFNVLEVPNSRAKVSFPFAKTGMHAGSALYTYEPIKPGKLKVSVKLKDVYVKTGRSGAMGFVVHESEFRRPDGTVVARMTDTMLQRP